SLPSTHDFVVGPAKFDLTLNPGESQTLDLTVSNRLGQDKSFALEVEDISGSENPGTPVILLGTDRGPYSLRDYLHFPTTTLDIVNGQKAHIPVTITVPADAQP